MVDQSSLHHERHLLIISSSPRHAFDIYLPMILAPKRHNHLHFNRIVEGGGTFRRPALR